MRANRVVVAEAGIVRAGVDGTWVGASVLASGTGSGFDRRRSLLQSSNLVKPVLGVGIGGVARFATFVLMLAGIGLDRGDLVRREEVAEDKLSASSK
jgi:hypothetical protein